MRVDERDSIPRFDILHEQISEKRRLSRAALPDRIDMLSSATGKNSKPLGLRPIAGDSQICWHIPVHGVGASLLQRKGFPLFAPLLLASG